MISGRTFSLSPVGTDRTFLDGDVLSGSMTTSFTTERSYGASSAYIRLERSEGKGKAQPPSRVDKSGRV